MSAAMREAIVGALLELAAADPLDAASDQRIARAERLLREALAEPDAAHVYAVTGRSVSGDEFGPFVFAQEPTEQQKRELIRSECDWAEENGPGDFGSYTSLSVYRVALRGGSTPGGTRAP